MSVLSGKNILLGVTGGIAAYKTAFLVRLFVKCGASVKVVMTEASKDFVTPLTLATLSKNPVLSSFTKQEEDGVSWNNHVELALWADIMLIAPATAHTLSKMANGTCDSLLLAVYLSAKCPVYVAPAMDLDMYQHPATKKCLETLRKNRSIVIPATHGELASGLVGEGRMAEPEDIFTFMERDIHGKLSLKGKNVLITAGPTYEPIDPVRFIGNYASGKMGFELAHEAARLGATVTLITGPTHLTIQHSLITVIPVKTAEEMYQAAQEHYPAVTIAILAAAVADYRPAHPSTRKIKKQTAPLSITLEPTKDILASLGKNKKHQFLVGFALETDHELEYAKQKLISKNLDAIVLNSLNDEGAGFGKSTNKITYIDKNFNATPFEVKPKAAVAQDIFNEILKQIHV